MSYSDKLEELQRLKAEVRRLERQAETEAKRMRPITELDERQMTSMQARADEAYQAAGRRAPAPLALESPDEFRRRLVIGLQGYSPRWQKADLGSLVDDALPIAESQVFADALQHGRTAGLQAREIRERVRTDHSGHRVVEFDGGPEAHFGHSKGLRVERFSRRRKSAPRRYRPQRCSVSSRLFATVSARRSRLRAPGSKPPGSGVTPFACCSERKPGCLIRLCPPRLSVTWGVSRLSA